MKANLTLNFFTNYDICHAFIISFTSTLRKQLNQKHTMNERDELLIKLANMLVADEWDCAYNLAEMTKTIETQEEIKRIAKRLYHKHEGYDI